MCYLKSLKIKKISGKRVKLENGVEAIYDKNIGKIKIGDKVMVYGNLIVDRAELDYNQAKLGEKNE